MMEMEKKILEHALTSWDTLPAPGGHFASQIQKEVKQTFR